jgi:hypothetical protein
VIGAQNSPRGVLLSQWPARLIFTVSLPFVKVVGHGCHQLFNWNIECFAYSQQRENRDGATGLHHLPVPDAEAIGNHVFLAQFTDCPARPDFLTQTAKKPSVMSRNLSGGSHNSTLGEGEQKYHEQNCVLHAKVVFENRCFWLRAAKVSCKNNVGECDVS